MKRGFTLIEVMLALALLVLLVAGVIALQWSIGDSRQRIIESARRSQEVGVLLERLEADLLTSIAGDDALGAGIKGDGSSLTVLARGVWLSGPSAADRATPEQIGAGLGKRPASDLVETRVALAAGELRLSRKMAGPGADVLLPAIEGAISADIEALRMRYFDGATWLDSFDSLEAGGLPAAVEIAVWWKHGSEPSVAVRTEGEADTANADGAALKPVLPERAPDRVRVIAVPEGGVAGAGGGR